MAVGKSHSLSNWQHLDDDLQGDLILAWANLGALLEGSLKLFLSVYYTDYAASAEKFIKHKNGTEIAPDVLKLEQLKQFFSKQKIFEARDIAFIELVQNRRNAIHAYQDKTIGNFSEFKAALKSYWQLLCDIDARLPYPD